ncbi:hypothetical protein [Thalassotalea euphylliae]|uniref:Uncharacterized protein n=1 Tax=Thalassotalea euphylliae TaxID=1655234 RepID=A0A3E0UGD3_9GAMM|nr:hypothetical protein [Thalassotalea euphylliae]REL35694.1 hypothetical protein DXX92_10280 [Thalassotalea euphylliae]
MEPTEESIAYIKERYSEEIATFENIENKCARYLTLITIIIVAFSSILGFQNSDLFKPNNFLEYLALISAVGAIFSLVCSFGHLLLCLKIKKAVLVPRCDKTSNWLREKRKEKVVSKIFDWYANAVKKSAKYNDEKIKPLKLAYSELVIAVWLISFFAITKLILELIKC